MDCGKMAREWWENNTSKAQWSKQLIPQYRKWIRCEHRAVDYYLSQVLTGHGNFKSYIKIIGKAEDDRCIFYGNSHTAEHVIFVCERCRVERNHIKVNIPTPKNLINTMLSQKRIDRRSIKWTNPITGHNLKSNKIRIIIIIKQVNKHKLIQKLNENVIN